VLGARADAMPVGLALVPAAAVGAAVLEVEATAVYGATPTAGCLGGGEGGEVTAILLLLQLLLLLLLLQ